MILLPMIIIAGTATAASIHWAEAQEQIRQMETASQAESGCLKYRIIPDDREHGSFFVYEVWESEESLQQHFQTPHMAAFNAYLGGLGVKMNIQRFRAEEI